MANLVIDIGNTYTKIAVFEHNTLLKAEHFTSIDAATLLDQINKYQVTQTIISSVKKETENWQGVLEEKTKVTYFNTGITAGVHNHYKTPETLGPDRLAAVIGAKTLYPGNDSLVIDAGTTITYDWIDAMGNYFGGSISPGLNMRYKALNYYTGKLPLFGPDENFDGIYGYDTATAIISGVQNGIKYEVKGFIESYRDNEQELNIILTGGDSIFFDTLLKNSIFAPYIKNEPYLVLKGLNAAIRNNND